MPTQALEKRTISIEYIAGLFDGEGCISCGRSSKAVPSVHLIVANTNYDVLEDLQKFWNLGRAYCANLKGIHQPIFKWEVTRAADIVEVLTKLLPYLRIKQEQAVFALQLCERIRDRVGRIGVNINDGEVDIRRGLAAEISARNSGSGRKETHEQIRDTHQRC